MKTLYDMLGIRPSADEEGLKKAFRRAVKASHPDLHADDPDAPLRFRQVIAANAILRDAKQRAAYDQLLACERRRSRSEWTRIIIADAIAVVLLGVVLAEGYTLVAPIFATSGITDNVETDTARGPDRIATIESTARYDTTGQGEPGGQLEETSGKVVAPSAAAPTANDGDALVIADLGPPPGVLSSGAEFPAEKDTAREPAGTEAVQAAARTDPEGRDGLRDRIEEVSDRVIAPNAAAPATNDGDAQVIADLGPPPGILSNDAKFHRDRGIASYRKGDFPQAVADLDQAIRLDPNDAQAYNIRGNAWDYMGAPDRALADYDAAIRLDPNNPAVFHDRGIMWRRNGELDRALVDLDRAVRFSFSDANIYSDRGLIWYEKGRHNRAIADFNQAVKIDPHFAAAYINRGVTLHRNSDFDRTFAYVDQTVRIDPKIFDAVHHANLHP